MNQNGSSLKAVIGSTVALPIEAFSPEELEAAKKKLTLKKRESVHFSFGEPKGGEQFVSLYRQNKNWIIVPRSFGIEWARERGLEIEDLRSEGEPIQISFNEKAQNRNPSLKVRQDILVEEAIRELRKREWNSGVLQSSTGTGKTAMGVKIACLLGRKTLIVVHNEALLEQWVNHFVGSPPGTKPEIPPFTDLKREDIGIIKESTRQISGKKVVIGMMQTLINRDFVPEERKAFGLIIWDEVHHLPAERFSETLFKFDAKYLLGLSATPQRFDGMDALLDLGLGGVITRGSISTQMVPEVWFVLHHTRIPEKRYMQRKEHPYKKGMIVPVANLGKLAVELIRIRSRNQYIVKKAVGAALAGRKTMVFSSRIRHLQWLKADFDIAMETLVKEGKLPAPKISSLFVGSVDGIPLTASQREEAKKADVMFCSYKMAAEGLDVPEADTIIFATPASFVRQVVGRILRPLNGKSRPVVIDILDEGVPKLEIMAGARAKEYRAMGATVHVPKQKPIQHQVSSAPSGTLFR